MPSSFSFSTSIIFTISSFANLSFVPINPLPEIASIFIPITTVGCAGLHRNHAILTEIYHTVFNFIRRRTAGTEQTTRIIKNVTDIYHNIRIRGGHSVNKHCFHGLYAESCISNRKFSSVTVTSYTMLASDLFGCLNLYSFKLYIQTV